MTPGQQRENERMLASILGVADDDAADLLLQAVQITWAPDDLAGSLLGGFVVQMLRRTFRRVGTPDDPDPHARCELRINSAPAHCAVARQIQAHLDAHGLRVGRAAARAGAESVAPPPVLALLSACFASAAVADAALGLPAGWFAPTGISVDFADWPGVPVEAFARRVDLGVCQMAGAGAVGNAIALALRYLPVRGQLIVIDPKSVTEGILNRCLCFDDEDIDEPKATRLAKWIATHCPGVDARAFHGTLQQQRAQRPGEIERLIVGVDSRRARRGLQEEVAREVFDASTSGVEEVVFHYNRLMNGKACLACVYAQTRQEDVFERHVADALGVTLEDVRSYLITPSAAARIALVYPQVGVEQLIGRAYDSVFREMCATQSLRTSEERQVLAPFGFVSQLAGTVAAIELFLRRADEERCDKFNYWRVSPWRGVNVDLQQDLSARSDCAVCASPHYQTLARRLWPSFGAVPGLANRDRCGEVGRGAFEAAIQEQGVST